MPEVQFEQRIFDIPENLKKTAYIDNDKYLSMYEESVKNPEKFWGSLAEEFLTWDRKWDKVLEWDFNQGHIEWFRGGKLNVSANCLDRHLIDGNANTLWHTEFTDRQLPPPHELTITLPVESNISAVLLTQRRDGEASGQLAEVEIRDSNGKLLARSAVPKDAANFRIELPPSTQLKTFVIRALKAHSGPFASLTELDVELPE